MIALSQAPNIYIYVYFARVRNKPTPLGLTDAFPLTSVTLAVAWFGWPIGGAVVFRDREGRAAGERRGDG